MAEFDERKIERYRSVVARCNSVTADPAAEQERQNAITARTQMERDYPGIEQAARMVITTGRVEPRGDGGAVNFTDLFSGLFTARPKHNAGPPPSAGSRRAGPGAPSGMPRSPIETPRGPTTPPPGASPYDYGADFPPPPRSRTGARAAAPVDAPPISEEAARQRQRLREEAARQEEAEEARRVERVRALAEQVAAEHAQRAAAHAAEIARLEAIVAEADARLAAEVATRRTALDACATALETGADFDFSAHPGAIREEHVVNVVALWTLLRCAWASEGDSFPVFHHHEVPPAGFQANRIGIVLDSETAAAGRRDPTTPQRIARIVRCATVQIILFHVGAR